MELAIGERRVIVTGQELVIGSGPEASLVVRGLGVLPRHACARMRPDGVVEVWSADAGTLLLHNGSRVGPIPQVLAAGDRLMVGDQEIVALAQGAAVGAVQRLNVTMAGLPSAGLRGHLAAHPAEVTRPAGHDKVRWLVAGAVVVALLAYLFLFRT